MRWQPGCLAVMAKGNGDARTRAPARTRRSVATVGPEGRSRSSQRLPGEFGRRRRDCAAGANIEPSTAKERATMRTGLRRRGWTSRRRRGGADNDADEQATRQVADGARGGGRTGGDADRARSGGWRIKAVRVGGCACRVSRQPVHLSLRLNIAFSFSPAVYSQSTPYPCCPPTHVAARVVDWLRE